MVQTFNRTAGEEYIIRRPECGELWIQVREAEMDFPVGDRCDFCPQASFHLGGDDPFQTSDRSGQEVEFPLS